MNQAPALGRESQGRNKVFTPRLILYGAYPHSLGADFECLYRRCRRDFECLSTRLHKQQMHHFLTASARQPQLALPTRRFWIRKPTSNKHFGAFPERISNQNRYLSKQSLVRPRVNPRVNVGLRLLCICKYQVSALGANHDRRRVGIGTRHIGHDG